MLSELTRTPFIAVTEKLAAGLPEGINKEPLNQHGQSEFYGNGDGCNVLLVCQRHVSHRHIY